MFAKKYQASLWKILVMLVAGLLVLAGATPAFAAPLQPAPALIPAAFVKISPLNGSAVFVPNPVLRWQASAGALRYEYCIDTVNNNACDSAWVNVNQNLHAQLAGLVVNTTYFWQVRALDATGATMANGGIWWAFRTLTPRPFHKISPANGAGVYVPNPTLTWGASTGALRYEYCIDTINNNVCDAAWINRGLNLNAPLAGLVVNTTYFWQVRAVGGFGTMAADGGVWWNFRTALPRPFSKISPVNGAGVFVANPTLTWAGTPGALRYEYCIDTINNNICDTGWINRGLNRNAPLAGLVVNTTYFWQVRAVNGFGITLANGGAWWAFRTSLPRAFTKISPPNGAFVYVPNPTLTWQASAGALRYEYCIDTINNNICDTGWINRGLNLNAPLAGLAVNTNYFWQVRATNGFGQTLANAGAWWGFRTSLPRPFNKISPANGATVYVPAPRLTWQASAGAIRYEYCIDTINNNACDNAWVNRGLNLNAQPIGLLVNTTYFWQVRAVGGFGVTFANNGVWFAFRTSLPRPFNKISPPNGAFVFVPNPTLTWQPSTGALRYEYCLDTINNNACDTAWVNRGLNLNAPLAGLVVNTTYFWQVRAVGGFGTTFANGGVWFAFRTSRPLAFSKISPANGGLVATHNPTLTWGPSSGAQRYEYCIDTINNNACDTAWVNRGLNLNAPLVGLANSTRYWQVRAVGGFGVTYANGALPAFWRFTILAFP